MCACVFLLSFVHSILLGSNEIVFGWFSHGFFSVRIFPISIESGLVTHLHTHSLAHVSHTYYVCESKRRHKPVFYLPKRHSRLAASASFHVSFSLSFSFCLYWFIEHVKIAGNELHTQSQKALSTRFRIKRVFFCAFGEWTVFPRVNFGINVYTWVSSEEDKWSVGILSRRTNRFSIRICVILISYFMPKISIPTRKKALSRYSLSHILNSFGAEVMKIMSRKMIHNLRPYSCSMNWNRFLRSTFRFVWA